MINTIKLLKLIILLDMQNVSDKIPDEAINNIKKYLDEQLNYNCSICVIK